MCDVRKIIVDSLKIELSNVWGVKKNEALGHTDQDVKMLQKPPDQTR